MRRRYSEAGLFGRLFLRSLLFTQHPGNLMPLASTLKRIGFVSIALALFLFRFEGLSTYASPPEEKVTQGDHLPTSDGGGTILYMPFVTDDHCFPCDSIPSPFSVSIADLFNVNFASQVQALKDSGAGWARIQLDWETIEANDDQPYNWTFYDNKLGAITAVGVRPIVIVDGIPDWADTPPGCPPISDDYLDEFAEFLTDLVNHYKQPPYLIQHWEIINEPDATGASPLGSNCWGNVGADYADMLAVAYPAIKAADPQATVLMGGIAYDAFVEYGCPTCPFNRYFPDDVMGADGDVYLDALNFHYFPDYLLEWEQWNTNTPHCGPINGQGTPYSGSGVDVMAKFNHLRNRMQTCFGVNKPIWITELAQHGYEGNPGSLAQQSQYVLQGYARGLAAGAKNITWYALKIATDDATNYPNQQGLLFDDLSPKPAFNTYKTMTAELKGYEYNRTLSVSGGGEAYVFRSPYPKEKTVAWGTGTLTFAPATQLRVVSRLGTITFIQDGGVGDTNGSPNAVGLQLTTDPVFIQVVS
jgi:hypothetical protein